MTDLLDLLLKCNGPVVIRQEVRSQPEIIDVIFNAPATIVKWDDGDKTIVKCSKEDKFDKRVGFLLCVLKKYYGDNRAFHDMINKWIYSKNEDEHREQPKVPKRKRPPKSNEPKVTLEDGPVLDRETVKKMLDLWF